MTELKDSPTPSPSPKGSTTKSGEKVSEITLPEILAILAAKGLIVPTEQKH